MFHHIFVHFQVITLICDFNINYYTSNNILYIVIVQEGAGHQVLSAFVEIVFDNSDNRIPVTLCNITFY
jgi:hypothetical protein